MTGSAKENNVTSFLSRIYFVVKMYIAVGRTVLARRLSMGFD